MMWHRGLCMVQAFSISDFTGRGQCGTTGTRAATTTD